MNNKLCGTLIAYLLWPCLLNAASTQPSSCIDNVNTKDPTTWPFVCSRVPPQGPSLVWPQKMASFKLHQGGSSTIPSNIAFDTIRAGFKTWTQVSGSQFRFIDAGFSDRIQVGYDFLNESENNNLIVFQKKWIHESEVVGLTTTTFNADTGEIFDADIELNERDYVFTASNDRIQTDLLNTVTHEIGHFLGFDHTDEKNTRLLLTCASSSTMAKSTYSGETAKRTLALTDQVGMRIIYPPDPSPVGRCYDGTGGSSPSFEIKQQGGPYSSKSGCRSTLTYSGATYFVMLGLMFVFRRLKKLSTNA